MFDTNIYKIYNFSIENIGFNVFKCIRKGIKAINRQRKFYPLKPSYTKTIDLWFLKTAANAKSTLLKGALKFISSENYKFSASLNP